MENSSSQIVQGIPVSAVTPYLDFNAFLDTISEFAFIEEISFNDFAKPPLKYYLMIGESRFLKIEEMAEEETTGERYSTPNCKRFKLRGTYYPTGTKETAVPVFILHKTFTCCCNFKDYCLQAELETNKGKFMGTVVHLNKGCYEIHQQIQIDNEEPLLLDTVGSHTEICCKGIEATEIPFTLKKGDKQVGDFTKKSAGMRENIMGMAYYECKLNQSLHWKQKLMSIIGIVTANIICFANDKH